MEKAFLPMRIVKQIFLKRKSLLLQIQTFCVQVLLEFMLWMKMFKNKVKRTEPFSVERSGQQSLLRKIVKEIE